MMQQKTQNRLTKEQVKSITLLSLGSTLEYFDLMLYVHMAVVLNDLFFPESGWFSKGQIAAFSLWSTHALRPLGAIFFGRIGDLVGRKVAVILSTTVMAVCCFTLAALPTYQQIGITAPIVLTLCRMIQGISASAEVVGAQIYLAESIKGPWQHPVVSSIQIFTTLGSTIAVGIGAFFINPKFFPSAWANDAWRFAFVVGALIGIVGAVARNTLKEATEFADRQRQFKEQYKKVGVNFSHSNIKVPLNTSIAYFFITSAQSTLFFLVYIYLGTTVVKKNFGFSNVDIVSTNFLVVLLDFASTVVWSVLSYWFYPLLIIRVRALIFFCIICAFPLIMSHYNSSQIVFALQCLLITFHIGSGPAAAIFLRSFPTVKRFRYTGVISSLAKSTAYFIGPSLLATTTDNFGYQGVCLMFVPITIFFFISVRYFEKKEQNNR